MKEKTEYVEIISEHENGTLAVIHSPNKHYGLVLDRIANEIVKLQPLPIVGYVGAERIEVARNLADELFTIKQSLEFGFVSLNERMVGDGHPPYPNAEAFEAVLRRCNRLISRLSELVPELEAPPPLRVVYNFLTRYGMRTKWEDFEQRRGVIQFEEPLKIGAFGFIMKDLYLKGHDLSACIFQDNNKHITWSKLLENGRKYPERTMPAYIAEIISLIHAIP